MGHYQKQRHGWFFNVASENCKKEEENRTRREIVSEWPAFLIGIVPILKFISANVYTVMRCFRIAYITGTRTLDQL